MSFHTLAVFPQMIAYHYHGIKRLAASLASASYFLAAVAIVSALGYGALTQLKTDSLYASRSLNKQLRQLQSETAENHVVLLKSAQEPDAAVSSLLQGMQDAAMGISFIHTNSVFVDASHPQP